MGATITWSPVNEQVLSVDSPSTVISQLEKVFGALPLELGMEHFDKIHTMSHMWSGPNNPYVKLMDAIMEYGTIRVKATY